MATVSVGFEGRRVKSSNGVAYWTLVVFSFLYFARPEDFIPGMGKIPIEKILGGIALLALIFGLQSRSNFHAWPRELKLLGAMFCWQALSVPFSYYIGGALAVVTEKCVKALITGLLVGLIVDSVSQLRRLIFIQAASVAVMTFASVLLYRGGRMGGVLGGVFDNPNDLAIAIALNFPLCLMFLMLSKNPIVKFLWFAGILIMGRGLMLTYSRSGFLALGVAVMFSLYEFGIRNKRHYLLWIAGACAVLLLIIGPQSYGDRIKSIFSNDVQVYGDAKEERYELLVESLKITATRPIFGVGPGQFASYSGMWQPTHNTYTEISSESGIPALVLFLLMIRECFASLVKIRKTSLYQNEPDIQMYTSALWAGFAGYLSGAAFAVTATQLFPYFMVGYACALYRLCNDAPETAGTKVAVSKKEVSMKALPGWMTAWRRS